MGNGFNGPPAVDFYSMLSGLGDTIAKNRDAATKQAAITSAFTPGPDGKIDYNRALTTLAPIDPQAAALVAQRQNHEDTLKQQAIENARNASRDATTDRHWAITDRRAAAAEGRAASDYENTPDQYVPNPKAGQPGEPQYIDQYAAAKAAGEASAPGGGGASLNPVYGVGADGKPAMVQTTKTGKAIQTELPAGFQISKEPIKVDVGTHINLIDPQTRQIIGSIPKNIAQAEAQKEVGSAQGVAQVGLPQALATAEQGIKTIEELKAHPGLDHSVGAWSVVPNIPGTAGADFNAKANQLKGQTFLQAYQTLRGSGAITDIEGKKGEDAIAALDRAQSKKQYVQALNDLKTVIEGGMLRAKAKAAGPTAAPASGDTTTNRTASGVPWSIQ